MKIVFLSNYYNHHQAPFCEAMYKRLGNDFFFIQTEEMEAERSSMGWGEDNLPAFVKKNYGNHLIETECNNLIENADVVIIGSAPNELVKNRIKTGRLVIRYSERQLKKGLELWKYPYRYLKWHKRNPRKANIYMLCASAYAASDYAKFGLFKNRCYKWGYFPAVKRYKNIDQLIESKHPASILWVARMIDWKHPELPILVAKKLKDENYSFEMNLIGNGVLQEKIQNMIQSFELEDCVHMLGAMKPSQVREHMEQSQIFLFTSDRNEGWGAVLNEAMNSGCAVVANRDIGSVPYLLKNGENGIVYEDGDFGSLYSNVKWLLDHPTERKVLAQNAYQTMEDDWNPETAAKRLIALSQSLLVGTNCDLFEHGVCTRIASKREKL